MSSDIDYIEHQNYTSHKKGEWDFIKLENNLFYVENLDTYINLNTTRSFIMLDEHNIRTIIINNDKITYLDTNFINTNTPLSTDLYHLKYCYLDADTNKWIYNFKKTNNDLVSSPKKFDLINTIKKYLNL
jgi:hypothetical protein